MSRTQLITHKGKVIHQIDFSNLSQVQEIKEVVNESAGYIRSQPMGSVLTLTKINDMHFSNEIRDIFNAFIKGNKPYVKGGAVVGLGGLQQIVYNGLMKITGREIKSFPNENIAKDWLAGLN
jgi:hypothetical protein